MWQNYYRLPASSSILIIAPWAGCIFLLWVKTQGFERTELNRFWPLTDLDPGAISDLAVWLWANELTSLSPSFLICQMAMKIPALFCSYKNQSSYGMQNAHYTA